MKILVTGTAGFMASHLAEYLANLGYEVHGVDNFSIGVPENVPNNIVFEKIDMRDAKRLAKYIEKIQPKLCFHLAAFAHEGLSQFCPSLITENNYNAFLNLIIPAINNGMKRIVVCSSMSVYGDQTPPFDESMSRKPVDIYAISKTAMEEATEILADVHDFDYTIVRPHNVYGPRQILHDPYRNVVGIFMNRIMQGKPPLIYGDGEQTRAFSYIDDITPCLAKAGLIEEAKGEIINIGPTEEYTLNMLARCVLRAFNSNLVPIHLPDRPREVKHAYCTNDKAKRILGYKTTVTLEGGVRKMAEWAKKVGPQKFRYLDKLELEGSKIPSTWKEKTI